MEFRINIQKCPINVFVGVFLLSVADRGDICRLDVKPPDYLQRNPFDVIRNIYHYPRLQKKAGACQEAPVPREYALSEICEYFFNCWEAPRKSTASPTRTLFL